MTTTTDPTYEFIAIERLHESLLNPRKHFDQAKLLELAASIRAKGVLTPLLVRPNAKGFEIAAGHRRYRAAKLAELKQLPAIVRSMSDLDFLEILTIENLQRDDLQPLEEAEGYHALIKQGGYDVRRIAERVGRFAEAQRLKHAAAPPPAPPVLRPQPQPAPVSAPPEVRMPKKDCKLCARKAPEKCKRHSGGAGETPTGGGKRDAKRSARKASRAPRVREVATPNDRVGTGVYADALTALRAERDRIDAAITALETIAG